jgi:hypothetical protein
VDLLHVLMALADAGEPVLPWLEQFRAHSPEVAAGLKVLRDARSDWANAISRVLTIMEGPPLLRQGGAI